MKKILIVEDDIYSQDLMRKIFRKDFETDICSSSEEYHEKYSDKKYCVMIIDVSIKGRKNGLEFIKEIRGITSTKNTPIICLTAHAQTKMREMALDSGADLFITKPVLNKTLKEAITYLIMRT
ncbi:hypothetical protein APF79_01380 [bacterium BRH_c32]|nr:MAG: hypothetical protein APF79_01380 [bacterium BRH_c32]